ncbi:hypothetical protein AB0I53_17105 [Saccharopolyspora sp. NPDC050389]|uniref:hypothetical protein n=1 Tax=Saccharopolyspora sp. NPDC050389 TaxID=3155516 RepID=UPI0033F69F65
MISTRVMHPAFWLAPEVKDWSGYVPNPAKVLSPRRPAMTSAAAGISSTTFVFSPVATTVLVGEIVRSRIKHTYERLTSVLAVNNGTTESTYLAETLIPLVAFGLSLSPVAAGPAAPLFNAPPVFGVDEATGQVHNLHSLTSVCSSWSSVWVITTASVPDGPNGPLIPEIHQSAPKALPSP